MRFYNNSQLVALTSKVGTIPQNIKYLKPTNILSLFPFVCVMIPVPSVITTAFNNTSSSLSRYQQSNLAGKLENQRNTILCAKETIIVLEVFGDTKGIIRNRKSKKDRHHNGHQQKGRGQTVHKTCT
jgi:hypothetical protein